MRESQDGLDAAPGVCRICEADNWSTLYRGPIRLGRPGETSTTPRTVWLCGNCHAGWLRGDAIDYSGNAYRELVDGDADAATHYRLHDQEQAHRLRLVGTDRLRGAVIADFGAGAGSFLDTIRGMAAETIAIEPTRGFHPSLAGNGHVVFEGGSDLAPDWLGRVDLAVCFSVVEHVEEPVRLLREIRASLTPGGRALVSTPNRSDWLLELLPESYAPFFYRQVHRWYFETHSLTEAATLAGFSRVRPFHVHRFDLSNLLVWLRDRRPSGLGAIAVSGPLDAAFAATLEASGRSDYLYAWLEL